MEERVVRFVAALRAAGVRVSLAESADAFLAIENLGIKDREKFRLALRATLVKEARDIAVFEELFPIFFGGQDAPPMMDISEDLSPEEAQMLAQALRQFADRIREMMERLLAGKELRPDELERLAKMVGLTQMDDLRYREWMSQRMQKALRFKEVQAAIRELAEMLAKMGMNKQRVDQIAQMLRANQQAIDDQVRQYAGQRISENMSQRPPGEPLDDLMNRSFSALSEREMQQLRREVQRLASILKTRVALRQKRAKSGHLDAKATIRANLKHGNVPIQIKHRDRTLKPRLVVICDVSTSMRFCSELMLSLLFHMQDQISKTHAFAFIDRLEFISPHLTGRPAGEAVRDVLRRMPSGYYNTDLGHSLKDFEQAYMNTVDSRTTLIVVGDGRNNYNNPRLEIFDKLARRSRRTIWLNPEAPGLWGTGDSDMLQYAPRCDVILNASTLAELTDAVDKMLL